MEKENTGYRWDDEVIALAKKVGDIIREQEREKLKKSILAEEFE